jgi:hypothetical protein
MRRAPLVLLLLLLLPAPAAADDPSFLRVDQTGFYRAQDVGVGYGVETARGIVAARGSDAANFYGTLTHRVNVGFGVTDWLTLGIEQNVKQDGMDFSVGVLAPEVRVGRGVAAYSQARIRINAPRPSTMVVGVAADRRIRAFTLAARAGFESTIAADSVERGVRYELGGAWSFARDWSLGAEFWGNSTWTGTGRQGDHHGGPTLQYDVGKLRLGLALAIGVRDRPTQLVVDCVGFLRASARF